MICISPCALSFGESGVSRETGASGVSGSIGESGPSGVSGSIGESGPSGEIRFDGESRSPATFGRYETLMSSSAWRAAAVEAERIHFFADDRITRAQAILARTWALKHLGEYSEAFDNLRRATPRGLPDELQYRIHHERALLMYLNGDREAVRAEISRLNQVVHRRDWQLLSGYISILALLELHQWEEAEKEMLAYFDELGIEAVIPFSPPSTKNPRKAILLSTFLPGTGQMYAGKTFEGLGSAGLQVTALGWGVYNVLTGFYATAFLTGGGLFQAFYFGGIDRAERHAVAYNQAAAREAAANATDWFLKVINPALEQKRQTLSDSPFFEYP